MSPCRRASHRGPANPNPEPLRPQPHPNTFLNDGWWSSTRTPNPRPPGPLHEGSADDEPASPQGVASIGATLEEEEGHGKRRWRLFRKGGE